MFSDLTPVATLPVKDLGLARHFYEETLGLTPEEQLPGGVTYPCGVGAVFVYPSAYAGTNKATAVSFNVEDERFDGEVENLRRHGVIFQTFEASGIKWQNDIAHMDGSRSVWFTDPDSNLINLTTM